MCGCLDGNVPTGPFMNAWAPIYDQIENLFDAGCGKCMSIPALGRSKRQFGPARTRLRL